MGGLLVLALIAGYVWMTSKICKRIRPYWGKALAVVIAILIPTADAIYGRIRLKQMCEAEGGLHIYRVVEGVEGVDLPTYSPNEQWLRKNGFKYVEDSKGRGGNTSRMTLREDGTVTLETGVQPISEYMYGDSMGNTKDTFLRIDKFVRSRSTGEILSRATNINYAGGWFERFISRLYAARGTAGTCGQDILITELVTKTLKPIQPNSTK